MSTPKERPIIFSGPMVRALLDGRKSQTRRVVKGLPIYVTTLIGSDSRPTHEFGMHWTHEGVINEHVRCPYGQPGDRLWVRETWCRWYGGALGGDRGMECAEPSGTCGVTYLADMARRRVENAYWDRVRGHSVLAGFETSHAKWRPSIHMPRWASRLTLELTEVRVQRLQEISEEDAKAEGVANYLQPGEVPDVPFGYLTDARDAFRSLWDSINGERAAWDSNSWVWAVSFRVLKPQAGANLTHDRMRAAR